jgi:methylated-DNA-[protein]-cysteine S-methyltransferase
MWQYTIFRTKWGYFGLAGTDEAVARTCLPAPGREETEQKLLASFKLNSDNLRLDNDLQQNLQGRIVAYYEGEPVDFSTDPAVSLDGAGLFVHKVLQACRKIAFGQTKTYNDLAKEVGSPNAARAVGNIMASNPIPLIIPCHRVLRADGDLGGFSAPGGTTTKQRMLDHEKSCVKARP